MAVISKKVIEDALVEYYQTPKEMRGDVQTLDDLAGVLEVPLSTVQRVLGSRPDLPYRCLIGVVTNWLDLAPYAKDTLQKGMAAGSVRATEVWADFVRKTLSDMAALSVTAGNNRGSIEDALEEITVDAGQLLELTRGLGDEDVVGEESEEAITAEMEEKAKGRAYAAVELDPKLMAAKEALRDRKISMRRMVPVDVPEDAEG